MTVRAGLAFLRISCAAFFVVAALAAGHLRAAAADTSFLTLQGPNPVSGGCPYTITFNGSITGPGNSSVTYLWARFANGQAGDSAPITATIPANGTLTLAPQPLTIDSSHAGFQSYGLTITSPAGSDSSTHGKMYLTAKCSIRIPNLMPAPAGLNATSDGPTCNQNIPTLFCNAALPSGQMAFWWSWNGDPKHPDVDGFNLYEVSPANQFGPPLSLSSKTTSQATYTFAPPPPGGFNGHCYGVSAYKGGNESFRGPMKCIGNVPTTQTQTLTGVLARSALEKGGNPGNYYAVEPPSGLRVGHTYETYKHVLGDNNLNVAYRTGVFVPLDFLKGHTVYNAMLRMHVNSAFSGSNFQSISMSCAWEIGAGTGQWWMNGDWIDGDFSNAVSTGGEFIATEVAFDITHLVQAIAGGAPNNGFVLKGREENMNAFTEQSCVTGYGTPSIVVTFI